MRAYDKLEEAEFFIARLARTKGRLPAAKHYTSAAVAALRGTTWVLQADLRELAGERFDLWWASRRPLLETAGIGSAELKLEEVQVLAAEQPVT